MPSVLATHEEHSNNPPNGTEIPICFIIPSQSRNWREAVGCVAD